MIDLHQRTVPHVLERGARLWPRRPAMADAERELTYAELYTASRRVAGGLAALGVGAGDRVALLLGNTITHVLSWFGTSLCNAIEVPLNPALRDYQIEFILADSGASVLVADGRFAELLSMVLPRLAAPPAVVLCAASPEQHECLETLLTVPVVPFELVAAHEPAHPALVRPQDPLGILYTSGTTGTPKGVVVSQAQTYGRMWPGGPGTPGEQDRTLVVLPIHHVIGQCRGLYNTLIVGGSVVLERRFSAARFIETCRRHHITFVPLVGVMVSYLLDRPPAAGDTDHTLRHVALGTTNPRLEEFRSRFGIAEVSMSYGLTEAGGVLVGPAEPEGCGYLRPDFQARLVDENDVEVAPGEVGELVLRPTEPWTMMNGYFNQPQQTLDRWRNLWLHTDDLMSRRPDGMYVFAGRRAERIRIKGENVAPAEIEEQITQHPAVRECAVVGIEAGAVGVGDQEILAAVVPADGAVLLLDELAAFLTGRLPMYAVPRYFRIFDALPRTDATQRVQKTAIAEQAAADMWDRKLARSAD